MPTLSEDRVFRFGVVAAAARSGNEWTTLARRVESLGFASLLVPDTVHTLAPAVACAVAAAVTTSLHVGPYVLSAANRSPGQTALETSTLSTLCDGRYELGVGAGRPGAGADAEVFGRPYGSPGQRVQAVRDTIDAVRANVPGTPIMVAGAGSRMLHLAGELADVVAFGLPPHADERALADAVDRVERAAAGRPGLVELSTNLIAVGDQPLAWMPVPVNVAELAAAGAIAVLRGGVDEMVGTLTQRRDQLGISYVCTSAGNAEALAPVVARLAGT